MIFEELRRACDRDPEAPAILTSTRGGRTLVRATRGELASLADRYAAALHARGVEPGDTVGLAARPGPRALALMLAGHQLGVCIALLDPYAGRDVLQARMRLARPRLVLADAAAQAAAGWARPLAGRFGIELPELDAIAPVATLGPRLPGCAAALAPAGRSAAPAGRPAGRPAAPPEGADAVIVFTSGTAGRPRAVVHTWRSLDAGMRAVGRLVHPEPGRPVLGGMFFVLVPALAAGAPVALPARSARALAGQLARVQPQHTYLTPPQLRAALEAGCRLCGRVWSGSAPVSAQLLARARQAGATAAYGVYALTEMFPVAVVDWAAKAAFGAAAEPGGEHAAGDLAGELVPGVATRIDGAGQLLLAGDAACDRYLGESTLDWVPTGDVARLDAGGRLVLAGRAKDMILRRAENIYPGLYEPALHIPGVSVAVLVGAGAPDGDELLVALVEPEPGADLDLLRAALRRPLSRMGSARPDLLLLDTVPLAGRSRKPDRAACARLVSRRLARAEPVGRASHTATWSGRP